MRWIRVGWRPLTVALGLVLLFAAIGYAAPVSRPDNGTVLHRLAARWSPARLGADDCAVVPVEQVRRLTGTSVRLTDRTLRPDGDGWRAGCGYGDSRLGLATATVTVTTGLDVDSWEPYRRASEHEPVRLGRSSTVGDETYLVLGQGPAGTASVRLEARDGRTAVRLEFFAPVRKDGGVPNPLPALRLARDVLSDASAPGYEPGALPSKAYAGCHRIPLDAAAEVLGGELPTARTIVEPSSGVNRDLHCSYGGEDVDLRISVWQRMDAETYLEPLRPNLEGIGDAGAFDATVFPDGGARMQAAIQVGDSIVSVDAGYADEQDVDRRTPTEAERELLKSIVQALA